MFPLNTVYSIHSAHMADFQTHSRLETGHLSADSFDNNAQMRTVRVPYQ